MPFKSRRSTRKPKGRKPPPVPAGHPLLSHHFPPPARTARAHPPPPTMPATKLPYLFKPAKLMAPRSINSSISDLDPTKADTLQPVRIEHLYVKLQASLSKSRNSLKKALKKCFAMEVERTEMAQHPLYKKAAARALDQNLKEFREWFKQGLGPQEHARIGASVRRGREYPRPHLGRHQGAAHEGDAGR